MSKAARWSSGDLRVGREERRAEQRAVEVVGPGVVRALEEARDVPGSGADLRAAMPAHVVEGAQLAVPVATHDERAPGDLDDDEVTRVAQLGGHRDPHPGAGETRCCSSS